MFKLSFSNSGAKPGDFLHQKRQLIDVCEIDVPDVSAQPKRVKSSINQVEIASISHQ